MAIESEFNEKVDKLFLILGRNLNKRFQEKNASGVIEWVDKEFNNKWTLQEKDFEYEVKQATLKKDQIKIQELFENYQASCFEWIDGFAIHNDINVLGGFVEKNLDNPNLNWEEFIGT